MTTHSRTLQPISAAIAAISRMEPPDVRALLLKIPMNGKTKSWLPSRIARTMTLPSRASSSRSPIRSAIRIWMIPKIRTTHRRASSPPLGLMVVLRLTTSTGPPAWASDRLSRTTCSWYVMSKLLPMTEKTSSVPRRTCRAAQSRGLFHCSHVPDRPAAARHREARRDAPATRGPAVVVPAPHPAADDRAIYDGGPHVHRDRAGVDDLDPGGDADRRGGAPRAPAPPPRARGAPPAAPGTGERPRGPHPPRAQT